MTETPAAGPARPPGRPPRLLLTYVRERGGQDAVDEVLRRAGVPDSAEELLHAAHWSSYDTRIRLFAAATEVLGDPATMFRVGAEALASGHEPGHRPAASARSARRVRSSGSCPRAVAKFSTTSTMEIVESGATSRHHPLHAARRVTRTRGWTATTSSGLLSIVPDRLRPARRPRSCTTSASPTATRPASTTLTWDRRAPRWSRRRRRDAGAGPGARWPCATSCSILQSAATDLVGQRRPRHGAAPDRRPRGRGGARARLPARGRATPVAAHRSCTAPACRAERVPGHGRTTCSPAATSARNAVVVDVASARRFHGRLAAIYPPGDGAIGDERSMLAAYAGHAAAALDLLMALEEARAGGRPRRRAAGAGPRTGRRDRRGGRSARSSAEALPRVVGCSRASIMLWDPAAGSCARTPSVGMTAGRAPSCSRTTMLRAEDTPELVGMLSDREPRIISTRDRAARRCGSCSTAIGVDRRRRRPAAGRAAPSSASPPPAGRPARRPTQLDGDVLARLRGVGDQAVDGAAEGAAARDRPAPGHARRADRPAEPHAVPRAAARRALAGAADRRPPRRPVLRPRPVQGRQRHARPRRRRRAAAPGRRPAARAPSAPATPSAGSAATSSRSSCPAWSSPRRRRRASPSGCRAASTEPFRLEGTRRARCGTSVGVAVHDRRPDSAAEQLLREADAAHVPAQGAALRAQPGR